MIEVLIVVAIGALMAGVSIKGIGGNKDADDEIEVVAEKVVSQLRSLQNEMLTGKTITVSGVQKPICRASFKVDNSGGAGTGDTSYKIFYDDCSGAFTNISSATETRNFNAKGTVTASGPTFNFYAPRGEMNTGSMSISLGSQTRYICVSKNIYSSSTICP